MHVNIFVPLLFFGSAKSAILLDDNHERFTHKAVDQDRANYNAECLIGMKL